MPGEQQQQQPPNNPLRQQLLDGLLTKLQSAINQQRLNLDYLEFLTRHHLILFESYSEQTGGLSEITEALQKLHHAVEWENNVSSTPTVEQEVEVSSGPGHPKTVIEREKLYSLLDTHLPVSSIAKCLGVSRRTLYRRMQEFGLSVRGSYSTVTDAELDSIISDIKSQMPNAGYRMVQGRLSSMGHRIQWWRMMASMHRVDGDGILSRFIAQGCVVGRSSAMRDPLSTVHIDTNDNLARLFSGDSKSNFNRGKKRSLTATNHNAKINSKAVAFKFYLLPKNTLSTPLPVEELELLQAGMGEQMVSLPENGDHTEISRLLAETFPKMEGLCGGWLLHKAKGGSGRRKLIAIPLEAEGYTTKGLRAMAAGGQPTFYIVPLQETLDTAPLPPNSSHFSKMPKTACYQCNKLMPFQMLAVHIKTCKENLSDDDDESDDESSDDTCVVESKCKVVCPICNKEFPEDEIKVHATLCGERFEHTPTCVPNDSSPSRSGHTTVSKPKSLEDVLLFLTQQIDTTSEFKLCVDREDLLDRGLRQWKRRKTASPASVLKVVYIGEADIDTEAIRKEFLTEMISGIEKRFFEGAGTQGKTPKYSLTDLDNDNFRTIGEIMAVSLAQGGPPPAFLKEWCYNFLCLGEIYCQSLSKDDVTDSESCVLISRVEDSTDVQSLMIYADKIINCGYTSQIKLDCKERIIQAIVKHSATRVIPMLQQLRKGMELYGLVNQMASNPAACHSLFVPGKITEPDADFMMMNCQPHYSEKGTSNERAERKVINFLQDFLEELEMPDGETDSAAGDTEPLTVPHVLQWMTGQSHIPVLPDERRHFKITFNFDHKCRERLGDHLVCYPIVTTM
ncbi:uncharacterized protein LOC130919527 isoform X2 [Corythoichthys intestinalis]|uniref:uncharacterized protein LOC130919527 isoform X2 n=1 Tax=Corythoichthys intestinalis TaxID=161448 RepID=UPI0025A4D55A|nr:uncharacterized protein LOC130919527 isoform X2 [Corythoichthys intestinalis]